MFFPCPVWMITCGTTETTWAPRTSTITWRELCTISETTSIHSGTLLSLGEWRMGKSILEWWVPQQSSCYSWSICPSHQRGRWNYVYLDLNLFSIFTGHHDRSTIRGQPRRLRVWKPPGPPYLSRWMAWKFDTRGRYPIAREGTDSTVLPRSKRNQQSSGLWIILFKWKGCLREVWMGRSNRNSRFRQLEVENLVIF